MAIFRSPSAIRFFVATVVVVTFLSPLLAFLFLNTSDTVSSSSDSILPFQPPERRAIIEGLKPDRKSRCGACKTAADEEASRVIQQLETEERSKAFEKIFETDYWGGGESRSGPGSRIDYTANVRRLIAEALHKYNVKHLLDAPCGDVNWQPLIEGINSTKYTGYDIVPQIIQKNQERCKDWENADFARVDFVNEPIAIAPDLIVCRDGIQHNTLKDGVRGFVNLARSGAKYLVTNWHTQNGGRGLIPDNDINMNVKFGGAYPINIFTHPFNFSHPEFIISEGVNGYNNDGKLVGVWKLPALWKGDGKQFHVPESLQSKVRQEVVFWDEIERVRGALLSSPKADSTSLDIAPTSSFNK